MTSNSKEHLIGKFTSDALQEKPFSDWFTKNYEGYEVDKNTIEELTPVLSQYTITLFMGTWCGDSKKEVPKFYKVLEASNFPMERLTAVAVDNKRDHYKQSPGGEHEGLNIHRVPTFIIYKNGKEVNRIVEHPKASIEADLMAIIKDDYTPNYEIVHLVDEKIKTLGIKKFSKKRTAIAKKLKSQASSYKALNTYANVLFYSRQTKESMEVAKLNQLLFPKEPVTYVSLGNKYAFLKQIEKAKEEYEKALSIDPENKWALQGLQNINSM